MTTSAVSCRFDHIYWKILNRKLNVLCSEIWSHLAICSKFDINMQHVFFSFPLLFFLWDSLRHLTYLIKLIWFLCKQKSGGKMYIVWKVSKYGVFSGPYFPAFGLRYKVSLRIQSEFGKIRTRKNSVLGHSSRSGKIEAASYWFKQINRSYLQQKVIPTSLVSSNFFKLMYINIAEKRD